MDSRPWHALSADETIKSLSSSSSGLTEEEAQARLVNYGANEIEKKETISPAKIFLSQFTSPLVIILILAAIFSYFIVPEGLLDAAVILIIVVLNAIFGFVQEYKAEKAIEALEKLTTPIAVVLRGGKERKIATKELVPGDVVLLEEGDRIPADCRLVEVVSLKVDEASLTGESIPVQKQADALKEEFLLAERKNMAYMGTVATYGRGRAVVTGTGMLTEMGKIAKLIQSARKEPTPLQKQLKVFGKNLGLIILAITAIVVVTGLLRGGILTGLSEAELEALIITMAITGIALAVAAIPEGLPAIVTITLAIGLQKLSRKNALIRKLPAVETLGSVTVICSDKTGTLTKNEMTVQKIHTSGKTISVTGGGYETRGEFLIDGKKTEPMADKTVETLLTAGILCNNARLSGDEIIGDPTEASIVVLAAKAGLTRESAETKFPRTSEIPFSSERKMMSTLHYSKARKFLVAAKGAPEVILALCDRISKDGKVSVFSSIEKKSLLEINHRLTSDALRVLAIAYSEHNVRPRESEMEKNLVFLGLVGMIDPPRDEVKQDISLCEQAGIRVVMITGDHRNTAEAIARDINILKPGMEDSVLTGLELEQMTDQELQARVEKTAVYARVNPEHKVRILDAWKKRGHIVAMTGDGVNDAPALEKADIGIAMGIKGTEVAKEASDMVLKDDNFSSIVTAIREGRSIFDNINKFIQYLLSSNMAEVAIVFLAMAIGFTDPSGSFLLPVTAIQLLWINLLTDGLPALALGVDPPAPDIMMRPPRNPKEKILSGKTLSQIFFAASIATIGVLYIFSSELANPGKAVTMAFTGIVVLELIRVLATRFQYNVGIFANKKLLAAIAASLLLQLAVIYIQPLQVAFDTTYLSALDWAKIVLVGAIFLASLYVKKRFEKGEH